MSKDRTHNFAFKSSIPSKLVLGAIPQFSARRRNAVRGIAAAALRSSISKNQLNAIRKNTSERDMIAAAIILESPSGLRRRAIHGMQQGSITRLHDVDVRSANLEAAYASTFINAWREDALQIVDSISDLSHAAGGTNSSTAARLLFVAKHWGASNYLARKITYVREYCDVSGDDRLILDEVDQIIGHDKSPNLQYSALETFKDTISIFSAARRNTSLFKNQAQGGFRTSHNLNNLVSTPYSSDDCAGFLLRAVETSLVDTVFSILIILNLEDRYLDIAKVIRRNISSEILQSFLNLRDALASSQLPNLIQHREPDADALGESTQEDASLSLYRRSAAFLEYPQFCKFRNDIDRVVGYRLVSSLLPNPNEWFAPGFESLDAIKRANDHFDISLHGAQNVRVDTFYRTYLFLRYIQNPTRIAAINSVDIQYVFDNTEHLESLLLESELKNMHLNASDEARALISVLALALYRSKSSDPDVDYDFRKHLEDYIFQNFNGSVPNFIADIAPKNPQVANYIASILDEVTLQKMYSIVNSVPEAQAIRCDILTTIGIKLNRIEYIIEAESIKTRAKVAKLKEYFDASRMYVDSIAMQKWLISNPSAYVQKYKELLTKMTSGSTRVHIEAASNQEVSARALIDFSHTHKLLVENIASDAFSVFCTDNEFGIESYLARRIRHNTLHGVMTSSVDAVLKREQYRPIVVGTPFGKALAAWETFYRMRIERMRKDLLQFKSENKPNALFNAALDPSDPFTKLNLQQLVHSLVVSGAELLHDLIISFCWQQIAPQLDATGHYIRVSVFQEIIQSLDHSLSRFNSPEEDKIKADLVRSLSSVLTQVASWFQVPQTGFVPASIAEICNIIDIDNERTATKTIISVDGLNARYYGISVHRIYDCLAVLLHNAFKHGEAGSDVKVSVSSHAIEGTTLHQLRISVISSLPQKGAENCVARVESAVTSTESSADLVTEGYSGIKKVKVITRLNEGVPTVSFATTGREITISFQLKAEVATEELAREDNLASGG